MPNVLRNGVRLASGELQFESVEEDRGWYLVEYLPPQVDNWFATLNVQVIESGTDEAVAEAMEREGDLWLDRYPVPILVTAFDDADGLRELNGARPSDHLMVYIDAATGEHHRSWGTPSANDVPHDELDDETLLRIYEHIPVTRVTEAEREAEFRAFARSVRAGRRLVLTWLLVWLAAIPVAVGIFEWAGPRWLGVVALAYCILKALVQVLKLFGVLKPSCREREAQEKQERMEHYYEHCEQNPEGFQRLMIENLELDARRQTAEKARTLREQDEGQIGRDGSQGDDAV